MTNEKLIRMLKDIIAAIERCADPNLDGDFSDHLDVCSLSLGGSGDPNDPMSLAIDLASSNGVVFTVAAGNSGQLIAGIVIDGRMMLIAAGWILILLSLGGFALDRTLNSLVERNFDDQLGYILTAMVGSWWYFAARAVRVRQLEDRLGLNPQARLKLGVQLGEAGLHTIAPYAAAATRLVRMKFTVIANGMRANPPAMAVIPA